MSLLQSDELSSPLWNRAKGGIQHFFSREQKWWFRFCFFNKFAYIGCPYGFL